MSICVCLIVFVSVEVSVEVGADSPEAFGAAMAKRGRERRSGGMVDVKRIFEPRRRERLLGMEVCGSDRKDLGWFCG